MLRGSRSRAWKFGTAGSRPSASNSDAAAEVLAGGQHISVKVRTLIDVLAKHFREPAGGQAQ
jgi:hypothetical protein